MTQAFAVWTEIPVTDMDKAMAFYNDVFGWSLVLDTSGPVPMATFAGAPGVCGGHLYPGKPAAAGTGNLIHLAVPGKLADAMERCTRAGGKVVSPVVTIPPGRFAYAQDPDGNAIGLFEPTAA